MTTSVVLVTNEDGPSGCIRCSNLVATELLGDVPAKVLEAAREGCVPFEMTDSSDVVYQQNNRKTST